MQDNQDSKKGCARFNVSRNTQLYNKERLKICVSKYWGVQISNRSGKKKKKKQNKTEHKEMEYNQMVTQQTQKQSNKNR